jgi:ankyrin repeat protein
MQSVFGSARRGASRVALAATFVCVALSSLVAAPVQAAPIDSLIKSVKFDDIDGVNKLLAKGMDPNSVEIQDKAGENAMMMAALNGDLDFVNLLIAKDAEVNKKGWAPLHYAAANGHDDIVKVLLDHSAYVDAGSPNGTTPLMMAARGGHVSTVKLLLDNGADLTVKNQIGMTALDFAKTYKEPDVVEGLTARLQQMQQK